METLSFGSLFDEASEGLFGAVLDQDLSVSDVMADPLIKHYAAANNILERDMTLRRTRMALKTKLFFSNIFKRKPKREARRVKRLAKREALLKAKKLKRQNKIARKAAKRKVKLARKKR